MKQLFSTLGLLAIGLSKCAQAYTLDPTFQPFFDIRSNPLDIGPVNDLWENPKTGKIYIVGGFEVILPNQPHGGFTSCNRDGGRNFFFNPQTQYGSSSRIFKRPGSELVGTGGSFTVYGRVDTTGNVVPNFQQWVTNYLNTANCSRAYVPYFYNDGSYLMSKDYFPNGCQIINPPDTFPHRYIVKVTPQGLWDTSFVKDATGEPYYFIPYDSNRILVYGSPSIFTHYDGVPIHGMCRIYLDGTLDTTFQSPLGQFISMPYNVVHIDQSGSIFLAGDAGYFFLKNHPNTNISLVKIKSNGMLDTTFSNFNGPIEARQVSNNLGINGIVRDICPTPDGGYLVGGLFDTYQGIKKHNLAKIDSNGIVDPTYFNTHGPDSSSSLGIYGDSLGMVGRIVKSAFGGYYIMGNFFTWDGAPVQGIVRIRDMTVSLGSSQIKGEGLKLYPNPTENQITLSSVSKMEAIEVYDLLGKQLRQIQTLNTHQQTLNLQELENGLYFIKVKVGEVWVTKKVVKR